MPMVTGDSLRCCGCRLCEQVCSLSSFGVVNPRLATVRVRDDEANPLHHTVRVCNECGDCAAACPAAAIEERDGSFRIDPELCTGCGVCVTACSRDLIVLDEAAGRAFKCTECGHCAETCPTGSLTRKDTSKDGGPR